MALTVFKSFRPGKFMTIVLLLLTVLFLTLGTWQSKRALVKETTEQQHQQATTLSLDNAISLGSRFARIEVTGHYDPDRHILLDNQIWRGQSGVYVFTPFYTDDGKAILVNRGWLPLAPDRKTMPDMPTPDHQTILRGMLNILPVPGRVLGDADQLSKDDWPQLVTYLKLADISESLEIQLEKWIIQLSKSEQAGFEGRDWKPVFMSSSRHRGYAFQWFALASTSIIMWLIIGFKKTNRKH